MRGKILAAGKGGACHPQGCGEADPVRGATGLGGGSAHEGADRKVSAQVPPDLLAHQLRGLQAQHLPGSALKRFQLIEGALDLPPGGMGSDQLDFGCLR